MQKGISMYSKDIYTTTIRRNFLLARSSRAFIAILKEVIIYKTFLDWEYHQGIPTKDLV